jgi:hypothetical protein
MNDFFFVTVLQNFISHLLLLVIETIYPLDLVGLVVVVVVVAGFDSDDG